MKDRPILFSGPMVRALLDGSKTQTRRVVKPHPPANAHQVETWHHPDSRPRYFTLTTAGEISDAWEPVPCPYGQPGDRLWVREAWSHDAESLEQCRAAHEDAMGYSRYGPYYRATETAPDTLRWRPSIHMPRWASRITLEITGVRVERLQDISDEDSLAEGVYPTATGLYPGSPREAYRKLWESINGPGSWDANPWVWVVQFRRLEGGGA